MDKPCYCFKVTKTSKANLLFHYPAYLESFRILGPRIPRTLVFQQKKLIIILAVLCLITQSCPTLWPYELQPTRLFCPWDSPGKNTGVGSLSLLQGIFPTQGSNPGLLHCRRILYHLCHQESPRILERVAYPSPGNLPDPGIELGAPVLQADSLPAELPGKPSSSFLSAFTD